MSVPTPIGAHQTLRGIFMTNIVQVIYRDVIVKAQELADSESGAYMVSFSTAGTKKGSEPILKLSAHQVFSFVLCSSMGELFSNYSRKKARNECDVVLSNLPSHIKPAPIK